MGSEDTALENPRSPRAGRESVLTIVNEILQDLKYSQPSAGGKGGSTLQRYRQVIGQHAPRLNKSVRFMTADLVHWMNRGGPWRAFLILSTGIVTLVGLTGLSVFLLFLITATVNTVIVALLGSVAAVGALAALFFTVLTGVYIGVLTVAAFVISTVAFFTIVAVVSVSGTIAFWWVVWLGARKLLQVAQGSLALTASTLRSVSAGGQSRVNAISLDKQGD